MRQADTDVTSEDGKESHAGTAEWVGELLGEWQPTEVRVARGFAECRGLNSEQLEDIYQETAIALLNRPYGSEEHLRNALRHGIKHRALNMHRDTRRRAQILQQSAPSMQRIAEARENQAGPEEAALQDQDRLIVREFLTELDELEQQVFWLIAEGRRYRAIAPILGIAVNEARNASRSCERKRERFQLLYDTGRLCGYRAATIHALRAGELTGDELARRAFAHLEACANCRAEHQTNAKRLGRSFGEQVAALLPLPALQGSLSWLHRPWSRAGAHVGCGVRERVAALVGAGGAGAKLTASVATVAVVAGGTVGATHVLEHHARTHRHRHVAAEPVRTETEARVVVTPAPTRATAPRRARTHWRAPRPHRYVDMTRSRDQRQARSADTQPATGREFAPESAYGAGANAAQTTDHNVERGERAAEREFGTPPTHS
jgi:RNA polymerase sigma factor (sigma-70 family)